MRLPMDRDVCLVIVGSDAMVSALRESIMYRR